MGTGARIGLLVAVAAAAFGGGFLLLGGDEPLPAEAPLTASPAPAAAASPDTPSGPRCGDPAGEDPAYEVAIVSEPDPPRVEGTTFRVEVTRAGEPVTGALVCLIADMSGMAHEGVFERAEEVAPGTYELSTRFVMRGHWTGSVRVFGPDGGAVRVPLSLNVG